MKFEFLGSSGQKVQIWKYRKYGVDVEMSPYLRRYKYFVKKVY